MEIKERFHRLSYLNRKGALDYLTTRELREQDRLRRLLKHKIYAVSNEYAKYCLSMRYLYGWSWDDIADSLGHNSSDAARKMCERTIKRM